MYILFMVVSVRFLLLAVFLQLLWLVGIAPEAIWQMTFWLSAVGAICKVYYNQPRRRMLAPTFWQRKGVIFLFIAIWLAGLHFVWHQPAPPPASGEPMITAIPLLIWLITYIDHQRKL